MRFLPNLLVVSLFSLLGASCVAVSEAAVTTQEILDGPVEQTASWGTVRCGVGRVCTEVQVIHVQRGKDGGPVEVTLRNRTEASVAVQVAIEAFEPEGSRSDRTSFHDIALAPRQDAVLEIDCDVPAKDRLVLHLRGRSAS